MPTPEATVALVECPACRTAASTPRGGRADGFDEWIQGRNFRQPPYAVHYCEVCGLYFKSEVLAPAALADYYALLDSARFEIDERFPTDRILTDRLSSLAGGSRVLDYGCSTGRILRSETMRLRCVGIEPNVTAAAIAAARGIAIIDDSKLAESGALYDAVLLTDVYEHLLDPVTLLARLATHLAPGGWLAVATGNASAVPCHSELASFWYFRIPGHLTMLTEQHLWWLSRRLNLVLADVRRCSHYHTPYSVRIRQHVQSFAYDRFRNRPDGTAARVMRWIPPLRRAERWSARPAFTCGQDHVVAFFERQL